MGGGGKNAASREAERARAEEEARQARIRKGTKSINETFGQFDDKFYGDIRDAFVNFGQPQLDDQFRDASEKNTYDLARSGTLDSSIRADRTADLQKQYDIQRQDLVDKARGYETEARNNVERARGDLISMLQVTGDATGAANSALTRAATLATPPSYSPLGQLFQDTTAMLGQQMAQERAFALGLGPRPRNSTGLFGPSGGGGSVKVSN
jgi:hypothetical protein